MLWSTCLASRHVKGLLPRRKTIYDDPFIRNYIEDLLKNIRTQAWRAQILLHDPHW